MLRTLSTAMLALGMMFNLSMGFSGDCNAVGSDEASVVRGGAAARGCVNIGSSFGVCYANQTCNPNVVPPVAGIAYYNNAGSATNACYATGSYNLYCPCGNTLYGPFTAVSSGSCYGVVAE